MAEPGKSKDIWDKIAIVFHPLGGAMTALAIAYIGTKGSQVLDRRQSIDTNARLYSELMSRREEAESSLRKDMLVSIIGSFLQPAPATDIDSKVLNLELLAYNFNDSLDLRPLFMDLQRRINASQDAHKRDYNDRLNTVGREIAAKQLFSLEGHGKTFRSLIDFDDLKAAGAGGLELEPAQISIRGISCEVHLRALSVDMKGQQLSVRMTVKAPPNHPELPDTRVQFDVGFFDFPMIDNTRLANSLRCAVTLANFSDDGAQLATVCFPGEYASLKDRPYYDEVIQKLRDANDLEKKQLQGELLAPKVDEPSASPSP
jgi:hypothetical protein